MSKGRNVPDFTIRALGAIAFLGVMVGVGSIELAAFRWLADDTIEPTFEHRLAIIGGAHAIVGVVAWLFHRWQMNEWERRSGRDWR